MLLPPFPPALRHGALRPKQRGQGLAAPLRAALSRPRVSPASFAVGCCLSSHVRWSAIQHNAKNYAQRKETRCSARARIICIMCKLLHLFLSPACPAGRRAWASAASRLPLPCSRRASRPPRRGSLQARCASRITSARPSAYRDNPPMPASSCGVPACARRSCRRHVCRRAQRAPIDVLSRLDSILVH